MDTAFALAKAGSQSKLARIVGVSRQAVHQWGEMVPAKSLLRLMEVRPKWVAEWRRSQQQAAVR